MKHRYSGLAIILSAALIFSGCAAGNETSDAESSESTVVDAESTENNGAAASETTASGENAEDSTESETADTEEKEYFSDRDLSGEIDTESAVEITLSGDSVTEDSDSVTVEDSTVTITDEGTYILSGTLDNGTVIVDAGEDDKVQLVLNGVSISSDTFASIYSLEADKVFITLMEGTENTLSNAGTFTAIDDNNVDAVIFSKTDLTLNGTGSLTIQSPAGHGIVSKDELVITGGTYDITSSNTALRANDSIAVADGTFTLNAGSDGLHAEDEDDESLGEVYLQGGTYNITAGDDGIHATTTLTVDGGTYTIEAAEGMEATYVIINDGTISIDASDDGINAAQKSSLYSPTIEFNGGTTTIVMGSGDTDGVDSNGSIVINGGTVDVTGTSTFDYDESGVINGGTVIANGEEITTLPTQMMGGGGRGGMGGGKEGGKAGMMPGGTDGTGGPDGTAPAESESASSEPTV